MITRNALREKCTMFASHSFRTFRSIKLVGFVLLDLQFYMYTLQIVVCSFVLFRVVIVLSVLLRYTDSDYPYGIFKLFSIPPAKRKKHHIINAALKSNRRDHTHRGKTTHSPGLVQVACFISQSLTFLGKSCGDASVFSISVKCQP